MLPTPATRFWSSRKAFTGARESAGERVQVGAGERVAQRLDAQPRGEEGLQRVGAERQLAGAEAPRVVEQQLAVAEREAHAHVGATGSGGSSSSVPVIRRCRSR